MACVLQPCSTPPSFPVPIAGSCIMASVAIHPPKTPVTKGSMGTAKATIPNVCKMPGPPAPFVPSPLPNIAKSGMSPKGYSTSVKIEGNTVAIRGASFASMGDMASKATGGGLLSANTHGPAKFITPGSMTVKIQGKAVHLLSEPMLNNCGAAGSPPNTGATMTGLGQTSTSVLDAQMELLCMIFCQCLQTRPFAKQGTNVGVDRSVFETPEKIQTKTNRFDNQKCVERELEGNPTLLAEQPFDMRRSPPAAITERVRGHRRPDVVCLAAPGPAAGLNITRIVEMKFPGDAWNDGQQRAYERIAQENNPDATVEMIDGENEPCICEKTQ